MKEGSQAPKILQSENRMFPDCVVANVCYHPSKRKNCPKAELEVSWVRDLSHRGKGQSRSPKGQILTSQWTILMHSNLMESALLGLELSWNGWSFNSWHFSPFGMAITVTIILCLFCLGILKTGNFLVSQVYRWRKTFVQERSWEEKLILDFLGVL